MKTTNLNLNKLEEKIWYRLLKVLYIILFIGVFIITTLSYHDSVKVKKTEYTITDLTNSYKKALESGKFTGIPEQEVFNNILRSYKSKGYTIAGVDIDEELGLKKQTENIQPKDKVNQPSFITKGIVKYYKLLFIYFILYLLFFQGINRIFYYITIGTFHPYKD